ncbi:MAG: hypothetical protein ABI852_15455 [Gemmatimonadaceae bacterium]
MRQQIKAGLWIAATFAVGAAFGMVLNGALSKPPVAGRPPARAEGEPRPMSFVDEMERVIQPRDQAQRDQLRAYLEKTDNANRAIVDGARASMSAALDSLRVAVAPMLDDAQRQRLAEFGGPPKGEGVPGMGRRGPPGLGGGRGRGRGPDGRGGPPPR